MKTARVMIGFAAWAAVLFGGSWWLFGRGAESLVPAELADQVWNYLACQRRVIRLEGTEACPVQRGDPIFAVLDDDCIQQVGEISVSAVRTGDEQVCAEAVFYASAPAVNSESRLLYHRNPGSVKWVLKTMLPPEKREAIAVELSRAYRENRDEIVHAFQPVVEASLRDALEVVEEELPPALEKRSDELAALGAKYRREIVEEDLLPIVREEVWPVVRKHAEPAVTEVGRELWNRVSLWRFGWRYIYDLSPLPDQKLTQQEWDRFLEEDAMPVLEDHIDDFVAVQGKILAEVAQNPKVRSAVRAGISEVISDPEAQGIFWDVLQEVTVDNPRMRAVLDKHWHSPEVEQALHVAAERVEPTAVRIGELLLGSPETGLTPEFARVLRNQVLGKDRRWLVLEPGTGVTEASGTRPDRLRLTPGPSDALYPFVREKS